MKPREESLDHETLTRILDYNPETGVFTWKVILTKNQMKIGNDAGWLEKSNRGGYIRIKIFDRKYLAHVLAWFYVYRQWPDPTMQLDHINLIKTDNRICNLRLVTKAQNMSNRARPKNNTTGFKGVFRNRYGT